MRCTPQTAYLCWLWSFYLFSTVKNEIISFFHLPEKTISKKLSKTIQTEERQHKKCQICSNSNIRKKLYLIFRLHFSYIKNGKSLFSRLPVDLLLLEFADFIIIHSVFNPFSKYICLVFILIIHIIYFYLSSQYHFSTRG